MSVWHEISTELVVGVHIWSGQVFYHPPRRGSGKVEMFTPAAAHRETDDEIMSEMGRRYKHTGRERERCLAR